VYTWHLQQVRAPVTPVGVGSIDQLGALSVMTFGRGRRTGEVLAVSSPAISSKGPV